MATSSEEKLLETLKDNFIYARDEWASIRSEAKEDMRYVSGNPWPEADRTARIKAGRPVMTVDELGQYVNQVINDLRMNKRGIKVTPNGNGATDRTAAFRQGKIRHIEYVSNAQQAYTTMAQDAIQRSYGYLKITAARVPGGWSKEPRIVPVVNPDLVLPDPDFLRSDGTDWRWLFEYQYRTTTQFEREFPDATKTSFTPDDMAIPGGWYDGKRLMLAAYWAREKQGSRRKLLLRSTEDGQEPFDAYEDELGDVAPSSDDILDAQDEDQYRVVQYLTNGFEILKTTPWPGPSIPYVGCYGKILYVDGKRVILSMVRLARDPAMLLNYIRSTQMEIVGMTPKFPYFFWDGSLSKESLDLLAKSLHEPVAGIPVRPQIDGGQTPGFPERNPYEAAAVQGLEVFAESIRRAIQAAMGTGFLPTQAQRQNEKSGKALDRINSSAQKGAFHFTDHYDEAITRTGMILNEVLPAYFDTQMDTTIRTPADEPKTMRINDPQAQDEGQPAPVPVTDKETHDVTISVGPAEDSQRESVNDLVQGLVGNAGFMQELGPQKGAKVLALSVKMLNAGPLADAIADIIDPPQKDGPNPEQIKQQVQQLGQENQQLKGALSKLAMEIQTKQADLASKERIAAADRASATDTADKDRAAKLAIAHITASKDTDTSARESAEEAMALGRGHAAESIEADKQRAHEVAMAHVGAATAADASAQQHAQGLESGDAGHAQALEQQEQAAALAPEPTGGDSGA